MLACMTDPLIYDDKYRKYSKMPSLLRHAIKWNATSYAAGLLPPLFKPACRVSHADREGGEEPPLPFLLTVAWGQGRTADMQGGEKTA